MSSINQIEIRRGTSNGTIETQIYDIGTPGVDITSAVYGDIFGAELISGTTTGEYKIKVKLRSAFDDFTQEPWKVIYMEIDDNIAVPAGGVAPRQMELYDSNENLIPDTTAPILKSDCASHQSPLSSYSVFRPYSVVTFICHNREDRSYPSYIQLTDNNVSFVDHSGTLTLH